MADRRIIITEWALASYGDLHGRYFSTHDYRTKLRPDILRLRTFPSDPRFNQSKFWGPAKRGSDTVPKDSPQDRPAPDGEVDLPSSGDPRGPSHRAR